MPSSVIRDFTYQPDEHRLIVEFQSGRRYAYFDVPYDVYELLRRARSRGAYFNRQIRDHYAYAETPTHPG